VHTELLVGPLAGDALTPVVHGALLPASGREDAANQVAGGARGRVDLVAVVHLEDFRVVGGPKDARSALDQVLKQIHTDGVVAGPHERNGPGGAGDALALLLVVAGGADDHGLAAGGCRFDQVGGGGVVAEVDNHVAGVHVGLGRVPLVDAGGQLMAAGFDGRAQGRAHAPLGAVEENFQFHRPDSGG
jgi:hypothetical protein